MDRPVVTSFPVLTTTRLQLRQLTYADAETIAVLRSDERVNRYIDRPATCSVEEAQAFIKKRINDGAENKVFYWAISLKDNNELIGTTCLFNFTADGKTAEVGYELSPAFHGKGILSEALKSVIQFCFETLNLQVLEAVTQNANIASVALLRKYGFEEQPARKEEGHPQFAVYTLHKTSTNRFS